VHVIPFVPVTVFAAPIHAHAIRLQDVQDTVAPVSLIPVAEVVAAGLYTVPAMP